MWAGMAERDLESRLPAPAGDPLRTAPSVAGTLGARLGARALALVLLQRLARCCAGLEAMARATAPPHLRCYTPRVEELLQRRRERQARFDAGVKPDWLPETKHVSRPADAHARPAHACGRRGCSCGLAAGRCVGFQGRAGGIPAARASGWSWTSLADLPGQVQPRATPAGAFTPRPPPPPALPPCFLALQVREGSWRVAALPADLQDRRVEITGPTDRKMVINALNRCGTAAGGRCYHPLMA